MKTAIERQDHVRLQMVSVGFQLSQPVLSQNGFGLEGVKIYVRARISIDANYLFGQLHQICDPLGIIFCSSQIAIQPCPLDTLCSSVEYGIWVVVVLSALTGNWAKRVGENQCSPTPQPNNLIKTANLVRQFRDLGGDPIQLLAGPLERI